MSSENVAAYTKKPYCQCGQFQCKAGFGYSAYYFTDSLKVTNTEVFLSFFIFILRGKNNISFK